MMILIDENLSSPRLAARLQAAGHDVVLASDVGLLSASDARVLAWAVSQDRCVLTRDTRTSRICTTSSWSARAIILVCSSSASMTIPAIT